MLALDQSFDETRTIKVLVVPIGNNSRFDDHFQVVSNLRDVPFYELNRPPASGNTAAAPFKYFNWNDGNLLFDFLRYDRVLIGPGDLNNFQSSKRVLMIMGLINYPELGATADKIEEEMEYFARRHPNILLRRLFVFNYTFDDPLAHRNVTPLMARIRDPASLVIFPPDGTCGNTNSSDDLQTKLDQGVNMVDVHLNEVMSHAALHIVLALEQQMRVCDDARTRNLLPEGLPLCTIFDELDESNNNNTPREVANSSNASKSKKLASGMYKKKPSGRIHKWQGDLCMQVCTPRDALDHYSASIADCKALGETLWLAGALDGYASAVLLLLQMGANIEEILGRELKNITLNSVANSDGGMAAPESVAEKAMRLAEDRINDAVAIYGSSVVYCALEVECLLRTARMHEQSPFHNNREAKVLEYVLRAVAVPGLNTQQQIEVTLECGLRCHRLGMWRKYALFLYIAALMSADNENYGVAHALIQYACNECGLAAAATKDLSPMQLTSVPYNGNVGTVASSAAASAEEKHAVHNSAIHSRQAGTKDSYGSTSNLAATWTSLRTSLCSTAALIADEHGESLTATQYLVALMQLIQEGEQKHADQRKDWLKFSPRKLFADEKLLSSLGDLSSLTSLGAAGTGPLLSKHTRSNSRTVGGVGSGGADVSAVSSSMERGVRWEPSNSQVPLIPEPYPAPSDRSPLIPRRTAKSEAEGSHSAGVAMDSDSGRSQPSARAGISPMAPRKLALGEMQAPTSAASSYTGELDREKEMNRYRSQLGGGNSTQDFSEAADTKHAISAQSSTVSSSVRSDGRRLAVPALPERLNSLSHLTHTTAIASRTIYEPGTAAASGSRGGWQGDFLIERFLRPLSQQESLLGSPAGSNAAAGIEQYSAAFVADALDMVAQLICSSKYPLELQEETHGLFARLSKSIAPCSWIPLPVSMLSVRPVALHGCRRPVLVLTPTVTAARKNLVAYKDLLARDSGSADAGSLNTSAAAATDTASSLFYDPFAAKRQKALTQSQKAEVLWAVGQECKFVAVFSNPLGVPVFLSAVFPVLQGADHTVYPISVHIPPNVETFEVELLLLPKAAGVLDVVGVQFIANNATHLLRCDKEGRSTDLPEQSQASRKQDSLAAASVNSTAAGPVATNTITVVAATLPLALSASWNSPAAASSLHTSSASTVDLTTQLAMFPGETREEQLSLYVEGVSSLCKFFDELASETHFKVTVREYSDSPKPASCIIMDYTGPLGPLSTADNSTSHVCCALVSTVHNSAPRSPSQDSGVTNTHSAFANLTLLLHPASAVTALDVEVEVCSAPTQVMKAIQRFRGDTHATSGTSEVGDSSSTDGLQCDAESASDVEEKCSLARSVEASQLTLYARCYCVRVHVQHTPGVVVTQLTPLQSAVLLPVPNYETASLRGALGGLLHASSALRRDLLSIPPHSAHCPTELRLVPRKLGVVLEVSNQSDWWACIGVSRAQIMSSIQKQLSCGADGSNVALLGANCAPQHDPQVHTLGIGKLEGLKCALLHLPPHSCRSVVLQYPTSQQTSCADHGSSHEQEQDPPLRLMWGVLDLSRRREALTFPLITDSKAVERYVRFGACAPLEVDRSQRVSRILELHSGGPDLSPLLRTVPPVAVRTQLFLKATRNTSAVDGTANAEARLLSSMLPLQPHLTDPLRGHLYSISCGKFYDLEIQFQATLPGLSLSIEVSVVVINNEVPVQSRESDHASQLLAPNSPTAAKVMPPRTCVMTGKPYCRYALNAPNNRASVGVDNGVVPDNGGVAETHRMRLCFPASGSFSVYALARVLKLQPVLSQEGSQGSGGGEWWTCCGGYFRVVAT